MPFYKQFFILDESCYRQVNGNCQASDISKKMFFIQGVRSFDMLQCLPRGWLYDPGRVYVEPCLDPSTGL